MMMIISHRSNQPHWDAEALPNPHTPVCSTDMEAADSAPTAIHANCHLRRRNNTSFCPKGMVALDFSPTEVDPGYLGRPSNNMYRTSTDKEGPDRVPIAKHVDDPRELLSNKSPRPTDKEDCDCATTVEVRDAPCGRHWHMCLHPMDRVDFDDATT
jgi:hypothetical protein